VVLSPNFTAGTEDNLEALSLDRQYPGHDSNRESLECKSRPLPL
jgi:hypothetical protein